MGNADEIYTKTVKVVLSCNTFAHFKSARNYILLAVKSLTQWLIDDLLSLFNSRVPKGEQIPTIKLSSYASL